MAKTLEQIEAQIKVLQEAAERIRQRERDAVIARVKEAIVNYKILHADLLPAFEVARAVSDVAPAHVARKMKVKRTTTAKKSSRRGAAARTKANAARKTVARSEPAPAPAPNEQGRLYERGALYTDGKRTWRGHARVPRWLLNHANGRPLSDFKMATSDMSGAQEA